ncbi:RagB/SusD family nutrient uptake outer membrane protein [Pedobacter frigoris]|uniref:RagB/SusD family nutrient uptake outer membrane protein n=1 Tax=Pedobacter frigoris TaxID=2571272 RepID=UPI002930B8BF|nr:RagB/SusD family nutrient uptake outer membrane protein [Pedobacter frigoris]
MKKILLLIAVIYTFSGCQKYLDIVPGDVPKISDAFKNENTAEGFLFSCYSYLPISNEDRTNFSWLMSNETVGSYHWGLQYFSFLRVQQGNISASDPVLDIWQQCYKGIRQCYIFLENLESVKPLTISESEFAAKKQAWTSEAKFLIAYFHFVLLQNYGPIVLQQKSVPANAVGDDMFAARRPYDECVAFIGGLFDEAQSGLPASYPASELGKPTKSAAQALKARMYLFAASPLFNGNSEFYADFKNADGTQLISQTYNKEKWKKAMDETKKAIDLFESTGGKLYVYNKTAISDPFEQAVMNTRWQMVDPWNSELIWGYSGRKEDATWANSFHAHAIPRGWKTGSPFGGVGATLSTVERFYTKNGLPPEKDPTFDWANRFTITPGDETIKLHRNREPRFYAYIGFDRGNYEIGGVTKKLMLRAGELNGMANLNSDHLYSGYAIKKGITPTSNVTSTVFSVVAYPYPIIRLGELYLNYAEACAEYTGSLDGNATKYMDDIRSRAGIPSLAQANGSLTGNDLIEAVRREKLIETMFEGHSLYDIKRWKQGTKYYADDKNGMRGMYSQGTTAATFYKDYVLVGRPFFFERKSYLYPINQTYVNVNHKLVQNPGW